MSQIPGNYEPDNLENAWDNYNTNPTNPSDLSSDKSANIQNSEQIFANVLSKDSVTKPSHVEDSILRSAILSDHLTDAELKKSKWNEAMETTGKLGKFKYKWNKVKSGIRSFINGFETRKPIGNLKSRSRNGWIGIGVFIKNAVISSLPVSNVGTNKNTSEVSPEMQSLYMDGIELGNIVNEMHNVENNPGTSFVNNLDLSQLKNISLVPYLVNGTVQYLNQTVDYGQLGENNPLDTEISSVSRRIPIIENSVLSRQNNVSLMDQSENIEQEIYQENVIINSEAQNQEKAVENTEQTSSSSVKGGTQKGASVEKNTTPKNSLAFFKTIPFTGLPLLLGGISGSWGSSSHAAFRVPQSGSKVIPTVNFSTWGKANKQFLDVSNEGTFQPVTYSEGSSSALISRSHQEISTGISGFFGESSSNTENKVNILSRQSSQEQYLSTDSKYNELQDNKPSLISSAYSFIGFSGFSAESSVRKQEEEKILMEKQTAATKANVLVYQYRALGLNPPMIFRSPSSYADYKRPYITGKPSTEAAYNDGNSEQNDSNRDQ